MKCNVSQKSLLIGSIDFCLLQQIDEEHSQLQLDVTTVKNKPKMDTVAIFRKWQDSSVALWIKIADDW